MNPIGRNQHIAPCGDGLLRTVAPREGRGDTMRVLHHLVQLMSCMNMVRADPGPGRLIDHPLQRAPLDARPRIHIAWLDTRRFPPDVPAEAVRVDQLSGANRHAIERLQETEVCQCLDPVWERVDANAKFTKAA